MQKWEILHPLSVERKEMRCMWASAIYWHTVHSDSLYETRPCPDMPIF